MLSLHSLVISVRHLGLPPGVNLPVVADLVKEYVEDTRGLEGWSYQKEEAAAQAAFDLAFLGLLSGAEVGKDVAVQKLLSKVLRLPSSVSQSLTDCRTPQACLMSLPRISPPCSPTPCAVCSSFSSRSSPTSTRRFLGRPPRPPRPEADCSASVRLRQARWVGRARSLGVRSLSPGRGRGLDCSVSRRSQREGWT